MSNRTSKQISSDKLLDKIVKDSVTKHQRRILFFSLRGTEVNINGEKDCVDILEIFPDITVKELIEKMADLGEASDQSFQFTDSSSSNSPLPPLTVAFGGPYWSNETARKLLTEYFCILGFGKAKSDKKFRKESSKPTWWPESLSWENFSHPGQAKSPEINEILTSMFEFFGLDIDTYHLPESASEEVRPRRRNRKRKRSVSRSFVPTDNEGETDVKDIISNIDIDYEDIVQDPQYEVVDPLENHDTKVILEYDVKPSINLKGFVSEPRHSVIKFAQANYYSTNES